MIDRESWNEIVINNNGSPLHSWEWNKAVEEFGQKIKWFFLKDDKASIAVPILIKYKVLGWIPYGIPYKGDIEYIKNKLKKFLFSSGILGIITNNYEIFNGLDFSNFLTNLSIPKKSETIILNLEEKSEDKLFSEFNSSTRKHIRRAIKNNIECVDFNKDDYKFFFSKYITFMEKKNLKLPISKDQLMFLVNLTNNKSSGLEIFIKKGVINDKKCGFLMVLKIGGRAHEFIRYDDEYFKKFYGPKLLTWEIMKELIKSNVSIYDFGGVNKKKQPGIYQYKIGFSGDYAISNGFRLLFPI